MLLSINVEANDRFRDYKSLSAAIASLGESRQVIRQVWLLHPTNPNFQNVLTELIKHINTTEDRLFIAEITGRQLNGWMGKSSWDWANQHNN